MKIKSLFPVVLLVLIAAAVCAQSPQSKQTAATPDPSRIVGVWRAQADGLPFVTLTITNETGSLSGAMLFYLHMRNQGQPATSTPGIPEPLFNPKFDGTTLTFQISHRRAHPPGSLSDPPVSFRLAVTGANQAGLINEREPQRDDASAGSSGLPMARTDY